jgi:hypothetical protein
MIIQCCIEKMHSACQVNKATIHMLIIFNTYFRNWLILSHLVKCFMATPKKKTWETVQQHKYHYSMFSQTVHLKKVMTKWTFFYFSAVFICNMRKECELLGMYFLKTVMYNLHYYWCCKFTIKVLLCNAQYFYIVDSDM